MVNKEYEEILQHQLIDVAKNIYPPAGAEDDDLVFQTYGMTIGGIGCGWRWFTRDNITDIARQHGHKPIEEATELELWKIIALCSWYWEKQYREWYDRARKKSSKLDYFIGHCERNYFGYDNDGYTDKTIDRIFDKVDKILQIKSGLVSED